MGWLVRVDSEQQREGGDGLLSAGQVGHGLEPLAGRYALALLVGLLRILWTKESLIGLIPGQLLFETRCQRHIRDTS